MTDTSTAQLGLDLRATDDAVRAKGWVSPGLGVPGASLGLLGSTLNPLAGLASAGLSWFMPIVSFLGEPLTKLQGGNAASVGSGAQDFGQAGPDISTLAGTYRDSTGAQTSGWSGTAASAYRDAGAQHADGIAGLGQASTTTGSAIIGAGQVVAQAVAEVTELIAEAVGQIVPIMSQAVARAPETFGQSIAEAIPPCVGIAVEYALKCLAKLAALMASGQNLMKLVQGAMAVVDLIKQALSGISQQSVRPDAEPKPRAAADQPQGARPASTMSAADLGNSGSSAQPPMAGSAPMSAAGGFGGGASMPGSASTPGGSAAPLGVAAQSTGAVPLSHGTLPDASQYPGHAGGGGAPAGAAPSGGVPVGTAGLAAGARTGAGRGADTVRQGGKQPPAHTSTGGNGAPGGVPMGGMGGARAAGETDKEHQRKYRVVEQHDEDFQVAPPVIFSAKPTD
jgi:hypothetical protein